MKYENTQVVYFMLVITFVAFSWFIIGKYSESNNASKEQLQNATLNGYYQAQIELNNIWVRDLSMYQKTYQNVYANNQTYTMECVIKQ